jgi:menaquinone-9 beta-reductase
MERFDVLVVGGGPAGTTVATRCAQCGLAVGLIEHKRFPRHKVCGDVLNPNCWPILERLGVAGRIRALPQQALSGALFTTQHGSALAVAHRGLRAINRSVLDAALLDHAKSVGVMLFEGETAHDVGRGWRVSTTDRELTSRFLVGADGRHSLVAQKAGLASPRKNLRCNNIALQAHFPAPPAMDDRVHLHMFAGGYCGIVRIDETRLNLCIVTDPGGARYHRDCERLFAHTVWQNLQFRALDIIPQPLEPIQSAHPLRTPPNKACGHGAFLVGDALRTVEPFTGQGIFFAMRTGELAAQAICEGVDFTAAVRALYCQQGRTNRLLHQLMYRERAADVFASTLLRVPALKRWFAGTVLGS